MSEEFKVEIVNPEKSFLVKEDVSEVVVPAFEGEMGILKDHISIISFLKPGIIKILSKSGDENFFVEDGIVEFKNNNLSILTSSIFNLNDLDKSKQQDLLKQAEDGIRDLVRSRGLGDVYKRQFLSQPFFVAEVFTGSPGKLVDLDSTIKGFAAICLSLIHI